MKERRSAYFSAIVNGGGTGRITGVVEPSSEVARVVERRGNDVERRNCSECELLGASLSLTSSMAGDGECK